MPEVKPVADAITPATVTPEVAADLYQHLQEQGRQRGTPKDLSMLLARATEREWGTTKARRFTDDRGGGWLIDLASYLDGEELYAMVRSSVGGSRLMTAVVDADELEGFNAGKGWQSTAARGNGVDPDVLAQAEAIENGKPPPTLAAHTHSSPAGPVGLPPVEVDPKDPMLVVVTFAPGDQPALSEPLKEQQQVIRATREEVPGIVKMLLSQGVRSAEGQVYEITEDSIEVWSSCSKPKVEVLF